MKKSEVTMEWINELKLDLCFIWNKNLVAFLDTVLCETYCIGVTLSKRENLSKAISMQSQKVCSMEAIGISLLNEFRWSWFKSNFRIEIDCKNIFHNSAVSAYFIYWYLLILINFVKNINVFELNHKLIDARYGQLQF